LQFQILITVEDYMKVLRSGQSGRWSVACRVTLIYSKEKSNPSSCV